MNKNGQENQLNRWSLLSDELETKELFNKNRRSFFIAISILIPVLAGTGFYLEKERNEVKRLNEERIRVLKASFVKFPLVFRFNKLFPKAYFQLNLDGENYVYLYSQIEQGDDIYSCELPPHKVTGETVSFKGEPKLYLFKAIITENSWTYSKAQEMTEEKLLKLLENGKE